MRKTILLLAVQLCTIICYAGDETVKGHGLKGKVKRIKETQLHERIENGKPVKSTVIHTIEFNEQGQQVKTLTTSDYTFLNSSAYADSMRKNYGIASPDTSVYQTLFTYNSKGQLIVSEGRDLTDNSLSSVIQYEYDERGRVIREVQEYNPNNKTAEKTLITYTYQPGSNDYETIISKGFDGNYTEREKQQYKPDANGNLLESYYYDYEAKMFWRDYSATYDNGKITSSNYYYPEGGLWHGTTYAYDSKGDLATTKQTNPDGTTITTIHDRTKKDKAGNYLHESCMSDAPLSARGTMTTSQREIEYYN